MLPVLQPALQTSGWARRRGGFSKNLACQHRPDLVLLDLNLPDVSGHEVLRRLRQDPSTAQIPVVVVSADALPAQAERLRAEGAQAYISKPFDVMHLLQILDEQMDGGDTEKSA